MKRTLIALACLLATASVNATVIFSDNFDAEPTTGTNYTGFANWTVSRGSVDLIGDGFYDYWPGDGKYVDLDGSTNAAGKMTSNAQTLTAGTTYNLVFSLAGGRNSDNTVTYGVDVDNDGVLDFSGSQTLASLVPFTTFTLSFTTTSATSTARIVFDHAGGDNDGLLLDNVQLVSHDASSIPEPATLGLLGLGLAGLGFTRRRKGVGRVSAA